MMGVEGSGVASTRRNATVLESSVRSEAYDAGVSGPGVAASGHEVASQQEEVRRDD